MKSIILSIYIITCFLPAKSQSTEDSVKAAINQLFNAMKNSDSTMLINCFADSAVLQTISSNKKGEVLIKNELIKGFAHSIGSAPKGWLDERIKFDMTKIDGPLASVWTPYSFYYNGRFSHCGVNSFQVIRTVNGWKIQYIIDTRRKEGCN